MMTMTEAVSPLPQLLQIKDGSRNVNFMEVLKQILTRNVSNYTQKSCSYSNISEQLKEFKYLTTS